MLTFTGRAPEPSSADLIKKETNREVLSVLKKEAKVWVWQLL